MAATATAAERPLLTVLEGGKRDDDWRLEEADAEVAALHAEAQEMSALLAPLMRKAMLAARHHGGAEYRNLAAIDHILSRFARRHAPDPERAA